MSRNTRTSHVSANPESVGMMKPTNKDQRQDLLETQQKEPTIKSQTRCLAQKCVSKWVAARISRPLALSVRTSVCVSRMEIFSFCVCLSVSLSSSRFFFQVCLTCRNQPRAEPIRVDVTPLTIWSLAYKALEHAARGVKMSVKMLVFLCWWQLRSFSTRSDFISLVR